MRPDYRHVLAVLGQGGEDLSSTSLQISPHLRKVLKYRGSLSPTTACLEPWQLKRHRRTNLRDALSRASHGSGRPQMIKLLSRVCQLPFEILHLPGRSVSMEIREVPPYWLVHNRWTYLIEDIRLLVSLVN